MQPCDRRVEIVERQFLHRLSQLRPHSVKRVCLVDHKQAMCLSYTRRNRIDIQRLDRAKVDHLAGNPFILKGFGCFEGTVNHLAGACDGHVRAFTRDPCNPKGHQHVTLGHRSLAGEQGLALEHQHGIAGPQRGLHQPLRIRRIGRQAHDKPRNMRPHRVVGARMVRAAERTAPAPTRITIGADICPFDM